MEILYKLTKARENWKNIKNEHDMYSSGGIASHVSIQVLPARRQVYKLSMRCRSGPFERAGNLEIDASLIIISACKILKRTLPRQVVSRGRAAKDTGTHCAVVDGAGSAALPYSAVTGDF